MNGAGAPEPEDTFGHALVGETIAGRLVVDKVLGAGAMGVVVSAKHPELAQRVAIKLLRPELARLPHVAARFLREARLAASVQSVNLVRVHDTGKHEGRIPYIVMELLSGQPLNEELERRGPFAPELAADTIVQVCAGLAELHARGVVHRDIKPNNLFVTKVAGVRTIKVLDFGISTAQQPTRNTIHDDDEPPLTLSEAILGTPQYMAPEQIRDPRNVDARSDIWSLGVVLYQLLTGTLPFAPTDGAVGEIFGLIMFQDPAPPSSRTGAVPKDLESVVLRCLQRDRDARFQSVAELATALLPFMAPASQHRVEGVRHALHASDLPPSMPAGTSPPNAGMDFGTARTELPEIQSTRPQAARYEQSPAATESRDSLDAGATAHSVRDLRATQPSAGSGRAPRAPAVRRRSLVALGAAMFLIAPVTPLSVGALRNQSVTSKSTPSKLPSLKTSDAPAAATVKAHRGPGWRSVHTSTVAAAWCCKATRHAGITATGRRPAGGAAQICPRTSMPNRSSRRGPIAVWAPRTRTATASHRAWPWPKNWRHPANAHASNPTSDGAASASRSSRLPRTATPS